MKCLPSVISLAVIVGLTAAAPDNVVFFRALKEDSSKDDSGKEDALMVIEKWAQAFISSDAEKVSLLYAKDAVYFPTLPTVFFEIPFYCWVFCDGKAKGPSDRF